MKYNRTMSSGISQSAKGDFASDRPIPTLRQQLNGFYVGQVMDDYDPRNMGRVWVYIPGISVSRFDADGLPLEGGEPNDTAAGGDYSQNVRKGWIHVAPILPFSGTDARNGAVRTDGSSPGSGQGNSYGMQIQARTGDYVALVFHDGDPSMGFFFGNIPPFDQVGMIPGLRGEQRSNVSVATGEPAAAAVAEAIVPVHDTGTEDVAEEVVVPNTEMERNIMMAGLGGDIFRGIGRSHFDRESPSYMFGIKTPGWSYNTEKNRMNGLGGEGEKFSDRAGHLSGVNTSGHQVVMDDHPENQLMRFRTSAGSQILMNDSGTDPFIYISTPTGGTWIEMNDSGEVNIYAQGSLNIHAESELNITADGGINMQTDGDMNLMAGGNLKIGSDGSTSIFSEAGIGFNTAEGLDFAGQWSRTTVGEDFSVEGNKVAIKSIDNMTILPGDDFAIRSEGGIVMTTPENMVCDIGGTMAINSQKLEYFGESVTVDSIGDVNFKVEGSFSTQSKGMYSVKTDNIIAMDGKEFWGLSGKAVDVDDLEPEKAIHENVEVESAQVVTPPEKTNVPAPPNRSDVTSGSNNVSDVVESVASVVPQHQPWQGRTGFGSINGTAGALSSSPREGVILPASCQTLPSSSSDIKQDIFGQLFRNGSIFPLAKLALPVISALKSSTGITGIFNIIFNGSIFNTDNRGEQAPTATGNTITAFDPQPNALQEFIGDFVNISEKGIRDIMRSVGFTAFPKPNLSGTGFVIGFNTLIREGMEIGGKIIDRSVMELLRNGNGAGILNITKKEAEALLKSELESAVGSIRSGIGSSGMTQGQIDSMSLNMIMKGVNEFINDSSADGILSQISTNGAGAGLDTFFNNIYVGTGVPCGVAGASRTGATRYASNPNNGGASGATGRGINYPMPTYDSNGALQVAGFTIAEDVVEALLSANLLLHEDMVEGALYPICAFESGFNRFAQNTISSAGGLFQFLSSTGKDYGIAEPRAKSTSQAMTSPYNTFEVYDAMTNAHAGALLTNDNFNVLLGKGFSASSIDSTILYLSHLLGSTGASYFTQGLLNSPNSLVSTDQRLARAVQSNQGVFGGRTYAQAKAFLDQQIEGKRQMLLNAFNSAGVPVTPGQPRTLKQSQDQRTWFDDSRSTLIVTSNVKINTSKDMSLVDPNVLDVMDKACQAAGIKEMVIYSGYRSQAEQDALYNAGRTTARISQHTAGRAIDIGLFNYGLAKRRAFMTYALADPRIGGAGYGGGACHIDTRPYADIRRRASWSYGSNSREIADIGRANGFNGY